MKAGTGVVTDSTTTSTEIKYCGDSFLKGFQMKTGTKSSSPAIPLTGYTATCEAILVETVEEGDSTVGVKPVGTCTVGLEPSTKTIESKCLGGAWVKNNPISLTTDITNSDQGEIQIYFPTEVLRKLGMSPGEEPKIGEPAKVQYTPRINQTAGSMPVSSALTQKVQVFRGISGFEIAAIWVTATVYAIGDVRYSPADDLDYICIAVTDSGDTTDPSTDSTNWARRFY